MKLFKKYALATLLVCLGVSMTSCSDDDDNEGGTSGPITTTKDNYTGYIRNVAAELESEALKVASSWVGRDALAGEGLLPDGENSFSDVISAAGYRDLLVNNKGSFTSNESVISQIIQGAVTIAKEVHEAKIGDPFLNTGVYGVESWYSFNTFTDYRNNIISIQKVIMGTDDMASISAANLGDKNSLYTLLYNGSASDKEHAENLRMSILKTLKAFDTAKAVDPTKPFRAYVEESFPKKEIHATIKPIPDAIAELEGLLDAADGDYKAADNAAVDAVIVAFVDEVVIDTYKTLYMKSVALNIAVTTYAKNPTQANLDAACTAWQATRIPWEQSEAWLFGPVDTHAVDPNIDSWPLDQISINSLLTAEIGWIEMEDGEEVLGGTGELAQSTKGFHTLEYLLFKDGAPRKIAELISGDKVTIESAN